MKISRKENISLIKIKKQKIKIILNIPKNNECFECSNLYPEFISLNNAIFLCKNCVKNHIHFPKYISNIFKNDLNNLTLKNIQYLCCGGNEKLKQFIKNEFPRLKKFSYQNLYRTYAMDYYRKYLEYLIEGGIKPIKPNKNKAYELIKINNNNIKKSKNSKINENENDNIEEPILKNKRKISNIEKEKEIFKLAKSSVRLKPNKPNKNKAYELLKTNNNKKIKNSKINEIVNKNDNIDETILKNENQNSNTKKEKNIFKFTKSSGRLKPNLNIILPNFNNSLNNFNTINIYNYNDKIYSETYYKKRFFSQIFKNDNIEEINEENNLTDLNNITFNKEKNLNFESRKKDEKKLDTNIKLIKRKDFLNKQFINFNNNNIYEKPFFQNYINTVSKGNKSKNYQRGIDLSSSDIKFFSNDLRDMTQKVNNSNTRNNVSNKNVLSSNKIFRKKTVGNSFSINYKNHEKTTTNNSKEENELNTKELIKFRNSNKYSLKNKLIEEFQMNDDIEEKGKIKVNRQINKNRKRNSLSGTIINNQYDKNEIIKDLIKERNHKKKFDKIQKSKIFERIRRVTSNQKEKKINYSEKDISEFDSQQLDNNKEKEYKINKENKSSLLIKDMINRPSNIKKNILEIIKSNNLSNLIISPNAKKLSHVLTEPKFLTKKDFTNNLPIKELYQRKKEE